MAREREARDKAAEEKKDKEAAAQRTKEERERKQKMREEAEAFKREMDAMTSAAVQDSPLDAVQTVSVESTAPVPLVLPSLEPPGIARQPSPIANVGGSVMRLNAGDKAIVNPLIGSFKDMLTFSKINRALEE